MHAAIPCNLFALRLKCLAMHGVSFLSQFFLIITAVHVFHVLMVANNINVTFIDKKMYINIGFQTLNYALFL